MKSTVPKPLISTLMRRLHLEIRQQLYADLVAAGYTDLTPAHMYVFQSPGPDGLRPSDLAARSNMTKQAMNHLLASLERGGYLERTAAPNDGRGTILRLTAPGHDVVRIMHESCASIERVWAHAIGSTRVETLRNLLTKIDAVGVTEHTTSTAKVAPKPPDTVHRAGARERAS